MSPTEQRVGGTTDVEGPLARAQSALRESELDAALVADPGGIAFLSGQVHPTALGYPSADGRLAPPTLALLTTDEVVTLAHQPAVVRGESVVYEPGAAPPDQLRSALAQATAAAGLSGGDRVGQDPATTPALVVDTLASLGFEPRSAGGLLTAAKAAKSDDEVAEMMTACSYVDAAHEAIRNRIDVGATELDLYEAVTEAVFGLAGVHVIVGAEIQGAHRSGRILYTAEPTKQALAPADLALSDIYLRDASGWWADTCSTICVGPATTAQRDVWARVRDGLEAGREALRPGVRAGDVFAAVEAEAGPQLGHVGHGVGRDHFEGPDLTRDSDELLPLGAVIALEPETKVEGQGIRLEWMYRVMPGGGEPLTSFNLDLT